MAGTEQAPKPCGHDDLVALNRRLARVNAESAELMAELEVKNEELHKSNQHLARANALSGELLATLELRDDEIRGLNRALASANASAAELLADRELHMERLDVLNKSLQEEVRKRKDVNEALEKSVQEVRHLQAILPICSVCKKIRDDDGYWDDVDRYISSRVDTRFSHGLCPSCMDRNYPVEE